MNIFEKGAYKPIPTEFRTLGFVALEKLMEFQKMFDMYDTDTTINSIRDSMVAHKSYGRIPRSFSPGRNAAPFF